MLATRISFMNEIANLAEVMGADVEEVRRGIGSDPRIGYQFLYAGTGYGGSCFPKDVNALMRTGKEYGIDLMVLNAVDRANSRQKTVLVDKVVARFGSDLSGRRFGMWGLAFKPNTDDMRDAPSREVIDQLTRMGATITAYDPAAAEEAQRVLGHIGSLRIVGDMASAIEGADALLILTEWREFKSPDFDQIKKLLKQPI